MHSNRLIIGIGNEYRSDDGVGSMAARMIREKKLNSVTMKEESGEGASLIEAWQGFENVIIVDAVSSGAKPGTVFKYEANKEILPAKFFNYSTHAFSLAEAIELARALNKLPSKLTVYGIEGKNFSAGKEISLPVREATNQVINQIMRDFKFSNLIMESIPNTKRHVFNYNNMNKHIIYKRSLQ
jgi:hydrogenase maturation protease